jgi:hypothetical protein
MVSVPTSPLILHCDRDVAAGVRRAGHGLTASMFPTRAQYPHDTSHDSISAEVADPTPAAVAVQCAVGIGSNELGSMRRRCRPDSPPRVRSVSRCRERMRRSMRRPDRRTCV